ncbi:AAA family ATPase [Pyxidicoccus xibeiensis]|uniref:AAA family ATPase n=1 Tax=Pyxidicoccus xibeiensis TaxID=2906759 RepID=UPI0020A71EB1|nr:ATP-binding protein [Pyxidicoccus xibeiensis]MCP3143847.1 ATP-binding protein [Pyxidicoccus xibeiensis]
MGLLFDALTIHRLRGLQELELTGLGRVNLLVGGNDSGKTTVLESLALYSNPLDPIEWFRAANRRDPLATVFGGTHSEKFRWLFPQRAHGGENHVGSIQLAAEGRLAVRNLLAQYRELRGLRPGKSTPSSEPLVGQPSRDLTVERRGAELQIRVESSPTPDGERASEAYSFSMWDDEPFVIPQEEKKQPKLPVRDIRPPDHWMASIPVKAFSEARLEGFEESVRALLQQIDPRITGLEILAPEGEAVLYLRDSVAGLVPVSLYGDGIRRTLLLALALPRVAGGVLLIDELETAIHVSALSKVFRWLLEACKQHDVQLFATTHSLEVVDAILGADTTEQEDIVGFRLERSETGTTARRFGEDLLKRLRYERGLDVR